MSSISTISSGVTLATTFAANTSVDATIPLERGIPPDDNY